MTALLCVLALVLVPSSASAKIPFQVTVHLYATGEPIAVIESERDLLKMFSQLLWEPEKAIALPPEAAPRSWDYRLSAYFDAELRFPTELLYYAARGGLLGVIYWEDAPRYSPSITEPLLVQSADFDAVFGRYIVPGASEVGGGSKSEPSLGLALSLLVVAVIATSTVLFVVIFVAARRAKRARNSGSLGARTRTQIGPRNL